jgi:hypothetical protein
MSAVASRSSLFHSASGEPIGSIALNAATASHLQHCAPFAKSFDGAR